MRLRGRLAVAAAGVLLACSSPGDDAGAGGFTVELDAFSGRPNPTWTLTGQEAKQLARHLRDLPPADGSHALPDRLGYRGFWITPKANGPWPESRLYVHDGVVLIVRPVGPSVLQEDIRGAEKWLIALASERGYAGVFRR
jgi:hypothetical protein